MKFAVVNRGIGHWYPDGTTRLVESLAAVGFTGDVLASTELPPGAPPHKQVPYAFKAYAMMEAAKTSDVLLWLDSSMWAIKPLDPIFDYAVEHGAAFVREGFVIGDYSTDACLAQLRLTRDDAMTIPMVIGGIFAVSIVHPKGRALLDRFYGYATDGVSFLGPWDNKDGACSADPRCKGHRHDMPALSILRHRLEIPMVDPPTWYSVDMENPDPRTLVMARGM